MSDLSSINIRLFQWINTNAGNRPFLDEIAIFFSEAGPLLLILGFIIEWFRLDNRGKLLLIEATEASIIGLLLNQVIGIFYFHPRPYMIGLCNPLIKHVPETSFPSDHVTFLFAASIYILSSRPWLFQGLVLVFISFLTAWARVYSGIHFPFDMLGSLVVGTLSVLLTLGFRSYFDHLNTLIVSVYERIRSRLSKNERSI